MTDFIDSFKPKFTKALDHFKQEISNLRVGRATPSLVENINVDAYGTPTPIVHLASISIADAKTINIQPWDKNLLKDIERALQQADLGASPVAKDDVIIINIPPLTEETRKEIIKKLNTKAEDTKVSIRSIREKIKDQVNEAEKNKEISEDDKFRRLEELEELVKQTNEEIKKIATAKEEEIMTI